MILNSGYLEIFKHYDCLILHDVNMLLTNDHNLHECLDAGPKHMSVIIDSHGVNRLCYPGFFGGVIAIKPYHYKLVNGFSNNFWGWGGEDDDFYNRVVHHGLKATRVDYELGRYLTTPHVQQDANPKRHALVAKGNNRALLSGLKDMKYRVVKKMNKKLFVWMLIDVGPSPARVNYRSNKAQVTRKPYCD